MNHTTDGERIPFGVSSGPDTHSNDHGSLETTDRRTTTPQDGPRTTEPAPVQGNLASTAHRTALRHALLDKMREIVDAQPHQRPATG